MDGDLDRCVKKPMKCLLLVILVARPLSVIIVVKVLVVMWVTKWKLRQVVLMLFVFRIRDSGWQNMRLARVIINRRVL